jgi:hypothetical protein
MKNLNAIILLLITFLLSSCTRNTASQMPSNSASPRVLAASIPAKTCNSSDVQAALNSVAADGTTVTIPAGNCTWTTTVTYNQVYSTIIQGAGAQTPAGGTDQTIIVDGVSHNPSDNADLQINTASGKSIRVTGLAFYYSSANATTSYQGLVRFSGSSQSVRIDDCHINLGAGNGYGGVSTAGWIYGVVDHNLFDTTAFVTNDIRIYNGGTWNNDPYGQGGASWSDNDYFGTEKFLFVEDNTFNGGFSYDCHWGGRFVFRHNTLNSVNMQTHGLAGDIGRSCREMEIYDNTLTWGNNPLTNTDAFALMFEGGTGMFWGNTLTGYLQFIHEDVVRTNNATYPQTPPPNGWGYCGNSVSGVLSSWDGNTDSTGYPCMDQVGRGKGQMLNGGDFPSFLNSVTNTISWLNQARDPAYVWGNFYNAPPDESNDALWSNFDQVSKENRDYYLQLPNYNEPNTVFNGTAGVGQGLSTILPGTCTAGPGGNTPGVGFWATDTNTFYVCTATNTWSIYYQPYVYPHPLVSGSPLPSPAPAPNPPTSLRLVSDS